MSPRSTTILRRLGIASIALFALNFVVGVVLGNGKTFEIRCLGGGVFIAWGADNVDLICLHGVHYIEYTRGFRIVTAPEGLPLWGFGNRWINTPMTRVAFFSWSPLPAVFLIWFSPAILRWFRGRKPLPGHCRSCGYDLTGNTSGVCPECGSPIAPSTRLHQ